MERTLTLEDLETITTEIGPQLDQQTIDIAGELGTPSCHNSWDDHGCGHDGECDTYTTYGQARWNQNLTVFEIRETIRTRWTACNPDELARFTVCPHSGNPQVINDILEAVMRSRFARVHHACASNLYAPKILSESHRKPRTG